jgi:hypothetical protein
MAIEPFEIGNESEADECLADLLAKEEYRSIHEVTLRAQKYIPDERLRAYFIAKAKAMLAGAEKS